MNINNPRTFLSEFISKLFKRKISRDESLFKGYIFVNFPKIYKDRLNIFFVEPTEVIEKEKEKDYGKDNFNKDD